MVTSILTTEKKIYKYTTEIIKYLESSNPAKARKLKTYNDILVIHLSKDGELGKRFKNMLVIKKKLDSIRKDVKKIGEKTKGGVTYNFRTGKIKVKNSRRSFVGEYLQGKENILSEEIREEIKKIRKLVPEAVISAAALLELIKEVHS